jgi:hypothetical protein
VSLGSKILCLRGASVFVSFGCMCLCVERVFVSLGCKDLYVVWL